MTVKHAADLEVGDQFTNPNNGEHVVFAGWDEDEDGAYALVTSARVQAINLDPAQVVNIDNGGS